MRRFWLDGAGHRSAGFPSDSTVQGPPQSEALGSRPTAVGPCSCAVAKGEKSSGQQAESLVLPPRAVLRSADRPSDRLSLELPITRFAWRRKCCTEESQQLVSFCSLPLPASIPLVSSCSFDSQTALSARLSLSLSPPSCSFHLLLNQPSLLHHPSKGLKRGPGRLSPSVMFIAKSSFQQRKRKKDETLHEINERRLSD